MKKKILKNKIRVDKDGYELGGPDLSNCRVIRGEEREEILKKAKRGPVKRFLDKITA